jgi:hypothetical protein
MCFYKQNFGFALNFLPSVCVCMFMHVRVCVCVDIFTQISNAQGQLVYNKFEDYLQCALALPTAVFEGPSFGYTDTTARTCFDPVSACVLGAYVITATLYTKTLNCVTCVIAVSCGDSELISGHNDDRPLSSVYSLAANTAPSG